MTYLSYMGTKVALADDIGRELASLSAGSLLDLFSGMSAIGRAVAGSRNVWINDTQAFSQIVGEFQFLSGDCCKSPTVYFRKVLRAFRRHFESVSREYRKELQFETDVLRSNNWIALTDLEARLLSRLPPIDKQADPKWKKGLMPYRLFVGIYAGTYFGLSQCIEIDALRCAIDEVAPTCRPEMRSVRLWMLVALGAALARCSNSTGHFAQYLSCSESNSHRVLAKRRRSIAEEWVKRLRLVAPVGDPEWRSGNKAFGRDACELLADQSVDLSKLAVIYADPPYTDDQYSRFYHLLDTMVLYDFPVVSGKGRYRADRFVSDWSSKKHVETCFSSLISGASKVGSALAISYPDNGLLEKSSERLPEMLSGHYKNVRIVSKFNHHHSTMGASHGVQKLKVSEQLFVAHN